MKLLHRKGDTLSFPSMLARTFTVAISLVTFSEDATAQIVFNQGYLYLSDNRLNILQSPIVMSADNSTIYLGSLSFKIVAVDEQKHTMTLENNGQLIIGNSQDLGTTLLIVWGCKRISLWTKIVPNFEIELCAP